MYIRKYFNEVVVAPEYYCKQYSVIYFTNLINLYRYICFHRYKFVSIDIKSMVFTHSPGGTKRFCVDYQLLNNNSVTDSFPLPFIDESIDALDGAKYFCTLDLALGYWQVPLGSRKFKCELIMVPSHGL